MAQRNLCSRREAEKLIAAGLVEVDGEILKEQGVKVNVDAQIVVHESEDSLLNNQYVVLLHKPDGYVSNLPQADEEPASDCIVPDNCIDKLDQKTLDKICKDVSNYAVAGRLDKASRGALILTNNGRVVKKITGEHKLKKVYSVRVESDVSDQALKILNGTVHLSGERLKPMVVKQIKPRTLVFELLEGKKHQIRKVCRIVNLNVMSLYRTHIGFINVLDIPQGKWRLLTEKEISGILN